MRPKTNRRDVRWFYRLPRQTLDRNSSQWCQNAWVLNLARSYSYSYLLLLFCLAVAAAVGGREQRSARARGQTEKPHPFVACAHLSLETKAINICRDRLGSNMRGDVLTPKRPLLFSLICQDRLGIIH